MRYLKQLPQLNNGLAYNYIFLMSSGNIKIGRSTNVYKRVNQLSNSNSGGYFLQSYCISPPNYVSEMMEKILHDKYKNYRIQGEYFEGLNFDEVAKDFSELFLSESFLRANNNKKNLLKQRVQNNA